MLPLTCWDSRLRGSACASTDQLMKDSKELAPVHLDASRAAKAYEGPRLSLDEDEVDDKALDAQISKLIAMRARRDSSRGPSRDCSPQPARLPRPAATKAATADEWYGNLAA